LEILLERIAWDDPTVSALLRLQQMRQPAFWISDGTDRRVCVAPKGTPPMSAGESHYAVRHDPSWRLLIVGGDPIAMAIAQLANLSGFETMMIRPDGPVQHPPLPGVIYSREDPRQMFETLGLDTWTAVITAMHDDEIDDAVIASALGQAPAYIGVLGAARRIKARTARLLEMGFAPDRIASVHAPIGSARCGKAPWEVAVSVLADVMERRNDQSATMDASAIPAAPSLTWVG
jgi:xanthine dehydrogenase accessory factor